MIDVVELPSTDDECRGGGELVDEGGCLVFFKKVKINRMTTDELQDMGFEFIAFKEPSMSCGVDLYYGYDYFIKKIGVKTDLILRKKGEKIKVEGFYCSDIKNKRQLLNLMDILT